MLKHNVFKKQDNHTATVCILLCRCLLLRCVLEAANHQAPCMATNLKGRIQTRQRHGQGKAGAWSPEKQWNTDWASASKNPQLKLAGKTCKQRISKTDTDKSNESWIGGSGGGGREKGKLPEPKGKRKSSPGPPGPKRISPTTNLGQRKRRRKKAGPRNLRSNSTGQPDRAYAGTNETKRFPN